MDLKEKDCATEKKVERRNSSNGDRRRSSEQEQLIKWDWWLHQKWFNMYCYCMQMSGPTYNWTWVFRLKAKRIDRWIYVPENLSSSIFWAKNRFQRSECRISFILISRFRECKGNNSRNISKIFRVFIEKVWFWTLSSLVLNVIIVIFWEKCSILICYVLIFWQFRFYGEN